MAVYSTGESKGWTKYYVLVKILKTALKLAVIFFVLDFYNTTIFHRKWLFCEIVLKKLNKNKIFKADVFSFYVNAEAIFSFWMFPKVCKQRTLHRLTDWTSNKDPNQLQWHFWNFSNIFAKDNIEISWSFTCF